MYCLTVAVFWIDKWLFWFPMINFQEKSFENEIQKKAPWLKVTFNLTREIIRMCAKVIWQNFKNQKKINIKYEETFQHKIKCNFSKLFVLLKGIDLILYPWSIACIHNLLKSNKAEFAIYFAALLEIFPKIKCILSKKILARLWMNLYFSFKYLGATYHQS